VSPHTEFVVQETSQVGAARRHAVALCGELGFDEVCAGRVAIIVTELGNNLVLHAREGRLLIGVVALEQRRLVEVISLDRGPGMVDTDRCLEDGYSTAGTRGNGLGAVRRLSVEFDIFSQPQVATVVLARVAAGPGPGDDLRHAPRSQAAVQMAGVCLPAPEETVSGDAWAAVGQDHRGRLILADGLGHGPEAARAADAAVAVFTRHPDMATRELLERAHETLRGTRGAAAALVHVDAMENSVSICGAGNVVGRLISGTEDRSLMTQHGTLGLQIRHTQETVCPWSEHAILVVHTDGIASRWSLKEVPRLLKSSAALIAAWILHLHRRGRDDATVVVARRC
jgi:anti-sigma regulatory factor (Ser/Thr protein kinase)